MKLWIDDIREAPEGWTRASTISEAISLMDMYWKEITHVSFDHDISIPVDVGGVMRPFPSPDTFRIAAKYFCFVLMAMNRNPVITTHSSNPDGRKAIVDLFRNIGIECIETPAEQIKRK